MKGARTNAVRIPTLAARRAALTVETAVILPALLLLVLGMVDLSVAVMRYHVLTAAARHGARVASVHGQLCPAGWQGGPWGPNQVSVTANSTGIPLADVIRPVLPGFDLDRTDVQAVWLDGGNAEGQRVQVTLTTKYQPMLTAILGKTAFTLSASSTLTIAH